MLLIPVLLAATHIGEPRLLQLRRPRDARNAMVAFYMTNLSSRFCWIALDCYYQSADVYKSSGLLDQKTSSRLDCICVCDTACVKTWNDVRILFRTRPAHLRECFSELLFCGSSVLKTRILKEATFLGEKFRTEIFTWRRWRTTQATKAWSWQEVLICASFPSTGSNHCALACFDKDLSRIALSRKGRLCEWCSATIALPALMSLRACLYSRSSAFFVYAVRFRCRSFSNSASLLRLSFETKGCITWVWDWPNLGDTSKIS